MKVLWLACGLLGAGLVWAQPPAAQEQPVETISQPATPTSVSRLPHTVVAPTTAGVVGQVVTGLLLVVGLIFVLAWLAKRFGYVNVGGQGQMRVIASLPLGAREKAVLVEVAGQRLLLGVAPGRVSFLQSLGEQAEQDNFAFAQQSVAKGQDFGAYLKTLIGSGKKNV